MSKKLIPVGLSNRHVHLSKEHIDILFGTGHQLNIFKDLQRRGIKVWLRKNKKNHCGRN